MSGRSRSPSVVAALLIGATGTFSPCGLSVIDTIGPTGHTGGRRTTIAACVAFLPGAIAGGLLTFGSLAAARRPAARRGRAGLLPGGGGDRAARGGPRGARDRIVPADPPSAARALAAGDADAGGRRPLRRAARDRLHDLRPLLRCLGPRRRQPRGRGPALGLLVGAASGWAGRSRSWRLRRSPGASRHPGDRADVRAPGRLPRPAPRRRRGAADRGGSGAGRRPGQRRRRRRRASQHATDPVRHRGRPALPAARRSGGDQPRGARGPAARPAPGDRRPLRRHRQGDTVQLLRSQHPRPSRRSGAPGPTRSRSRMPGSPTAPRSAGATGSTSATSPTRRRRPRRSCSPREGGAAQLSPPAVDGNILLYAVATPRGSRVVQRIMGTRKHRTLVRSPRLLLFDPAVEGKSFAYVRTDARRSRLMVRRRQAPRVGPGPLHAGARAASSCPTRSPVRSPTLTILEPSASNADATIVRVSRRHPQRLQERGPRGGGNHRF